MDCTYEVGAPSSTGRHIFFFFISDSGVGRGEGKTEAGKESGPQQKIENENISTSESCSTQKKN